MTEKMPSNTQPSAAEQARLGMDVSISRRDFIGGTLADVIEGRCAVDRSKPIVFSPFGLGILDIAVAQWVYERARALGQTLVIDSFFGTGEA